MNHDKRWIVVVVILLALGFFSIISAAIFSLTFSSTEPGDGNVALIPVNGVISTGDGTSIVGSESASSSVITDWIEKADKDPRIKAIVFEIDSPGGTPVGSDEIAQAIKDTNKTTVAWIREIGASGAYWVASACDYIIANRMSITGSIGVRGSYLGFSGLLDHYNITYNELYAGKFKETGSPFKNLTDAEREKLMEQIDQLHEVFIDEVSMNRNMSREKVKDLATGETFLGVNALGLGLIDALGTQKDVVSYLQDKLNITVEFVRYSKSIGFVDLIRGLNSDVPLNIGKGIGQSLMAQKEGSQIVLR